MPNTPPQRYELKSPIDGSILAFDIRARRDQETSFDVAVKTPWFYGTAASSTYMVPPLANLFHDMAAEWTGWIGEKSWTDLENNVEIRASADKTGHISLSITLTGHDGYTQLRTCLQFEAGQLERFAEEVALLFS